MNKKLILLIIAICIFLIVQKLAYVLFFNKNKNISNKIYIVKNCNLPQGCKLSNKYIIYVNKLIKLNLPFEIKLYTNKTNNSKIYVFFSMKNMNMIFNKYNLQYDTDNNIWLAKNVILPVCSEHRHDYILNLVIDNLEYQIPFKVQQ